MEDEMHHPLLLSAAAASPATSGGASFTALLGLPPSRAVELLHHEPTFPSDPALVDRAARLSVFANVNVSSAPSPPEVSPPPPEAAGKKRKDGGGNGKAKAKKGKQRREGGEEEDDNTDGENNNNNNKLPYVHVRARRGQATDSHSLAERIRAGVDFETIQRLKLELHSAARREKINARMKLLQELVPGCSKISGTALVLDEIINHVQYLQRQVEYLSMRLAAVNPRIDFSGLDNFISSTAMECGRLTIGNAKVGAELDQQQPPAVWSEVGVSGANQMNNSSCSKRPQSQLPQNHHLQQFWHVDLLNSQNHLHQSIWPRDAAAGSSTPRDEQHAFVGPGAVPLLAFDCINAVEAPIQSNQLKMEL